MGCWTDKNPRALEKISGRINPPGIIHKCLRLARDEGYQLFALQDVGGECYGGADDNMYQKYGRSTKCSKKGMGGAWANQVYKIKGDISITLP